MQKRTNGPARKNRKTEEKLKRVRNPASWEEHYSVARRTNNFWSLWVGRLCVLVVVVAIFGAGYITTSVPRSSSWVAGFLCSTVISLYFLYHFQWPRFKEAGHLNFLVIGPMGAGKSSLVKTVFNVLEPKKDPKVVDVHDSNTHVTIRPKTVPMTKEITISDMVGLQGIWSETMGIIYARLMRGFPLYEEDWDVLVKLKKEKAGWTNGLQGVVSSCPSLPFVDCVIFVLNPEFPDTPEARGAFEVLEALHQLQFPFILVLTHADESKDKAPILKARFDEDCFVINTDWKGGRPVENSNILSAIVADILDAAIAKSLRANINPPSVPELLDTYIKHYTSRTTTGWYVALVLIILLLLPTIFS